MKVTKASKQLLSMKTKVDIYLTHNRFTLNETMSGELYYSLPCGKMGLYWTIDPAEEITWERGEVNGFEFPYTVEEFDKEWIEALEKEITNYYRKEMKMSQEDKIYHIHVYHGLNWTQDWIVLAETEEQAIKAVRESFEKRFKHIGFPTNVKTTVVNELPYLVIENGE